MATRQVTPDSGQRSGATMRTAQENRNVVVTVVENTAIMDICLGERIAVNVG